MKLAKNVNLPVSYSVDAFDNDRFLKLRVKVMHTGLNLNNSNFDLAVVEAAKHTLANIPLLAFIKKVDGEDSNGDFAGHEYEIKITEDDAKYVYLGRPIGIIPESNNYEVVTEDGKTFVLADAYVWKDYANSALDILDRDQVKKISMEIVVDDYEYNDSYMDIKAYKYTGVALLGEDVREAMIGAKAEVVNFSENSIAKMMGELKEAMATFSTEDPVEPIVVPELVPELVPEVEPEEDPAEDPAIVEPEIEPNEDKNAEELIDGHREPTEPQAEDENADEVTPEEDPEPEVDEADTELNKTPEVEPIAPISERQEEDNFESTILNLQAEIETLKAENETLKTYQLNIETEKENILKQELFAEFSDLDETEIETLKEKELSLDDLEIHLFALRGKKVKLGKGTLPKLGVSSTSYSQGSTKKEPVYAGLIRQCKQVQ